MKQYLLQLFFLLFAIQVVIAQQFPVQVIPQTIPPRPVVLSDYANASSVNDKVRVQLILNDLTELNREVRLKLFIEGQGINAQSNDVVVGATPIFLEGGVATTLGTAQLAPYFDLQNLQGISPGVYGNSLPEGSYSFCFEVYDLFTGNVVSAKTCTNFVLFDNDPPLLNLPLNAAGIQEMNPLNIVFQWTPRHINVSNVQYELIVSEIWDLNIDPQAAFLSSPPIFQTTTTQTTFIYDGLQPSLIPGKRYGWRVRAFAAAGAEEIGVFTNNGFSEIFYFDYQTQCDEPLFPDVDELTNRSAKLIWQGNFDHLDYTVKYREKDAESEWYDLNTPREYADIDNLNAETTYEYKIQGNCMFGSYGETFIQEFTTLSDEASSYQGCAIEPEPILLENQERLTELFLYDNFTAGKFKVRVLEVENSISPFKGKGYVTIPWLGFITIAAEFENIELNTDKELISGAVVTTYDPDWGNVLNTDGVFDDVFGNNGDVIQFDASDMVISDVQVSADGAITLIDNENNSVPIVVGTPVVITDSTGNQWLVTNDGEVVELGPAAEGGVVTSENTNGVSSSGSVTAISSQDVVVTFTDSGFYAFDPLPAGASSSLASEYNTISQASGGTYDVPYKAISDITGHTTDFLEGNVTFANGKTKSDLIFKTTEGTAIDTTWSGNTVSLSLTKQFEFGKTAILATVKPADSTGNYDVAGTADLWHMSAKTVNVTVVPINGSSTGTASQIQTELNTIYEKAGISFNVDLKDDFEVPANVWDIGPTTGSLDVGDSGVFSNYSPEENAIKNYYKDARDIEDDQYYMFVFNNVPIVNEDPSKNTQGFMPLKRQYGFVFNNSTTTMAHELGHGVFGLEHYTESGTDDFLMHEENITGTVLPHVDWQTIHAAGLQLYLFQGDSDGEIGNKIWFTPDWLPFRVQGTSTISSANSDMSNIPKGTIPGFKLNGQIYSAVFDTQGNFINYSSPDGDNYTISRPTNLDSDTDVYLFRYVSGCGTNSYYKSLFYKINNLISNTVRDIDFQNSDIEYVALIGCTDQGETTNMPFSATLCSLVETTNIVDANGVSQAIQDLNTSYNNRNSVYGNDYKRPLGEYYHLVNASAYDLDKRADIIEDKLFLLKERTGINFYVIYEPVGSKMDLATRDDFAQQVLDGSDIDSSQETVIITVPYFTLTPLSTGAIQCIQPGFAQNNSNIVQNLQFKSNDSLFDYILEAFTDIEKPLYLKHFYVKANGNIVTTNFYNESIRGKEEIQSLQFYESTYISQIQLIRDNIRDKYGDLSYDGLSANEILGIYNDIDNLKLELDDLLSTSDQEESDIDIETNAVTWNNYRPDNLGDLREIYIDDPDVSNAYFESQSATFGFGQMVLIFSNNNDYLDNDTHFYDFDKYTLLDPVIYNTIDGLGMVLPPPFDTLPDAAGLVYATARSNHSEVPFYIAGLALPVGAAYLKLGSKVVGDSYIIAAKLTAEGDVVLRSTLKTDIATDERAVTGLLGGKQSNADALRTELDIPENKDKIRRLFDDAGDAGIDVIQALKNSLVNKGFEIDDLADFGQDALISLDNLSSSETASMIIDFNVLKNVIKDNPSLVDSWRKVINQPDWVRKNTDLLSGLVGKSDEFIERVNVFYNNIALPANLPKPLPSSITHTFNGQSIVVNYNKYGLPEFGSHMTRITDNGSNVSKTYKGTWNQVTSSNNAARTKDLKDATNWALETDAAGNLVNFPNGRVRRYTTPSGNPSVTKIEILDDNGNWIEQTWHHHENGRDLIPVPSEIHNPLNHSGGFAAKHGPDGTTVTPDTDVTEIFDYDPVIN